LSRTFQRRSLVHARFSGSSLDSAGTEVTPCAGKQHVRRTSMTTRSILRIAELLILISTVAFVMPSLAQDTSAHHSRYRLVQIGTFGGPNSIYNVFSLIAANDGTVVGAANTSVPDPHTPCFDDPVCFVQHAWKWHDCQFVDLGVLPG